MSETINPNTHIILYAKNWYQKGNLIDDLRILVGNKCGIEPSCIVINDIISVLLKITIRQILVNGKDYEDMFGFVLALHPDNRWQVGGHQDESFEVSIIRNCLSVLRLTKTVKIQNLGAPDPSILPLNP